MYHSSSTDDVPPVVYFHFALVIAAAAGISAHIFYFTRGFREHRGLQIVIFHLLAGTLVLFQSIRFVGVIHGILSAAAVNAVYLSSLFGSIVIYRLFFHRLRHFPGPWIARVTKFYGPW